MDDIESMCYKAEKCDGNSQYQLGLFHLNSYLENDDLLKLYEAYAWLTMAQFFHTDGFEEIASILEIIDERVLTYPNHLLAYGTTHAFIELLASAHKTKISNFIPKPNWIFKLWKWQSTLTTQPLPLTKHGMKNAARINLEAYELTNIPKELFFMDQLSSLYISNNLLNELPDTIGMLKELTYLNCGFNYLSNLPDQVMQLSNLTNIELCYNKFTHIPHQVFELKNLTGLSVFGNPIGRIHNEIEKLTHLERLDLRETYISELPSCLARLKHLKTIILSSKYINEDTKKEISALLPQCDITYDKPWMSETNTIDEMAELINYLKANGEEIPEQLAKLIDKPEDNDTKIKNFSKKLPTYPMYKIFNNLS